MLCLVLGQAPWPRQQIRADGGVVCGVSELSYGALRTPQLPAAAPLCGTDSITLRGHPARSCFLEPRASAGRYVAARCASLTRPWCWLGFSVDVGLVRWAWQLEGQRWVVGGVVVGTLCQQGRSPVLLWAAAPSPVEEDAHLVVEAKVTAETHRASDAQDP